MDLGGSRDDVQRIEGTLPGFDNGPRNAYRRPPRTRSKSSGSAMRGGGGSDASGRQRDGFGEDLGSRGEIFLPSGESFGRVHEPDSAEVTPVSIGSTEGDHALSPLGQLPGQPRSRMDLGGSRDDVQRIEGTLPGFDNGPRNAYRRPPRTRSKSSGSAMRGGGGSDASGLHRDRFGEDVGLHGETCLPGGQAWGSVHEPEVSAEVTPLRTPKKVDEAWEGDNAFRLWSRMDLTGSRDGMEHIEGIPQGFDDGPRNAHRRPNRKHSDDADHDIDSFGPCYLPEQPTSGKACSLARKPEACTSLTSGRISSSAHGLQVGGHDANATFSSLGKAQGHAVAGLGLASTGSGMDLIQEMMPDLNDCPSSGYRPMLDRFAEESGIRGESCLLTQPFIQGRKPCGQPQEREVLMDMTSDCVRSAANGSQTWDAVNAMTSPPAKGHSQELRSIDVSDTDNDVDKSQGLLSAFGDGLWSVDRRLPEMCGKSRGSAILGSTNSASSGLERDDFDEDTFSYGMPCWSSRSLVKSPIQDSEPCSRERLREALRGGATSHAAWGGPRGGASSQPRSRAGSDLDHIEVCLPGLDDGARTADHDPPRAHSKSSGSALRGPCDAQHRQPLSQSSDQVRLGRQRLSGLKSVARSMFQSE